MRDLFVKILMIPAQIVWFIIIGLPEWMQYTYGEDIAKRCPSPFQAYDRSRKHA